MAKNTLNAHGLLLIGEWFATLRHRLLPATSRWGLIEEALKHFSTTLKDAKHFEFIGQEAGRLLGEFSSKYYKPDAYLDANDIQELMSTLARWEGRLEEISKQWILTYPDTHIDAAKLVQGLKGFLSEEDFNILHSLEIHGLNEAASSLLFNNSTSAEFMALRTAESLLKSWYEKKTDNKLGRTTWGEVLDKLNDEFPEKERPKELHLLDYLRQRRNEIAHPEAVSTSVTASTTFLNVISLCKSLI